MAQALKVDPRDYKISRLLLARIWRLTRPYWWRRAAWPSWIAMAALLLLAPGFSLLGAYISTVLKNLTDVIVARQVAAYWPLLWFFLAITCARALASVGMGLLDSQLSLHWRAWLSTHLIDQYLAKRTYYDIALAEDLDNPDQRIQETVGPFTQLVSFLPRRVLSNITDMAAGVAILATIDVRLVGAITLYAVAQTVVMFFLYVPTIKQNFDITVAEADLRYSILHVRDNAETVAFYRGEGAERTQILARVATAVRRQMTLILYQLKLDSGSQVLGVIWQALPYLLLVPLFFAGKTPYGSIAQGAFAATQILNALQLFMNFAPQISQMAPLAVRLAEIQERFAAMGAERSDPGIPRLVLRSGNEVRLECVTLQTPGGEQALVKSLSLRLPIGDHLVITGQTGVGKSSLLRAMAGLWTRGSGVIEMPPPDTCLFLPQRPYMILADLRAQLLYPRGYAIDDESLCDILEQVNLHALLAEHGGLDAVRDWGRVLSLGEQQRIAFARILVSRPDYVFLDEATSAVDLATEARLYRALAASGASYVSVGHRASIMDFHSHNLHLIPGGGWTLGAVSARAVSAELDCGVSVAQSLSA